MIYVKLDEHNQVDQMCDSDNPHYDHNEIIAGQNDWQSRHDWKSFEQVEQIAAGLTKLIGDVYLAVDQGSSTWPRYDVMKAPKVGDKVSYAFNGDYYPDGEIVGITNGWRITTSTGNKYNRRKNSGSWRKIGGTWSLVQGHINERNPHF